MSRSARLLDLIQAFRRRPVAAAELATELGVSARTVYRDIGTLVAQGAPIQGEAGLGYVMGPGFFLPPLMFGEDEVDAVLLGLRLVIGRGDGDLAEAAEDALAKVMAMLPPALEEQASASGLLVGTGPSERPAHLETIRKGLRTEDKLRRDDPRRDCSCPSRCPHPCPRPCPDDPLRERSSRQCGVLCRAPGPAGDGELAHLRDVRAPLRQRTGPVVAPHRAARRPCGGGGGELAWTGDVDALHAAWSAAGWPIAQAPTDMEFGRTFVALDPDGHRLRVFAPSEA